MTMSMRMRTLGRTDLEISPVAFGTFGLGGGWGAVAEGAVRALARAWERGINLVDTAHAYGFGEAEEVVGRTLADPLRSRRDDIVLLTKGGVQRTTRGVVRNGDPEFLTAALQASLRSLGTDHVDIHLLHWPDPTVPVERAAETAMGFIEQGYTRFVGVSNFSVEQMERFAAAGRIDVVQLPYSLLRRDIEAAQLPWCRERGIPVLGYQPYAGGLLTGALTRDTVFGPGDWRGRAAEFRGESYAALMDAVDRVRDVAAELGCTVAQLALAWVAAQPAGIVPVTGAEHPDQVDATLAALDIALDATHLARIDEALRDARTVTAEEPPVRGG
jgi:aryl-alcohol dehydrogenase-like predicted oxidoreductase